MRNSSHLTGFLALGASALASLCFLISITVALKLRRAKKYNREFALAVEQELGDLRRDMDAATKQIADQARRIAWMESRIRPNAQPIRDETIADRPPVADKSITERRHRVLALARRGYDVHTIATMLGELHGEVELIIGLNNAA